MGKQTKKQTTRDLPILIYVDISSIFSNTTINFLEGQIYQLCLKFPLKIQFLYFETKFSILVHCDNARFMMTTDI